MESWSEIFFLNHKNYNVTYWKCRGRDTSKYYCYLYMLRDISMNEAIFKDIGKNVVFHRKLNGMNQIDLAKRLNMGVAKLSRIERGIDVIDVPLSVYISIAESLNVFVTDLLKSTDVRVKNICVRKSVK